MKIGGMQPLSMNFEQVILSGMARSIRHNTCFLSSLPAERITIRTGGIIGPAMR